MDATLASLNKSRYAVAVMRLYDKEKVLYTDNEILFPYYAIPALRHVRGEKWTQLIEKLSQKEETSAEVLALMSVMIELDGCLSCETDGYRAMRGCIPCARQTLRRFEGSDEELIEKYERAAAEFRESVDSE